MWRDIDTCPQFSSGQIKKGRFKVVEDINELGMERGILEEYLRNTTMTEGQLACAYFVEGNSQRFRKTLEDFMDDVLQEVVVAERSGNGFKAKTSSGYILPRKLPNNEFLEVFLESISCLLIPDDHLLDDTTKGGDRAPSREWDTA
jgi:hypothetical protein